MIRQISLVTVSVIILVASVFSQQVVFPVDSVKGPMCVVTDTTARIAVPLSPKRSVYPQIFRKRFVLTWRQ